MEGFIKIDRKIDDWKYSKDPYAFRIWIKLLTSATIKDYQSGTWTIKRGQWKGSARNLSNELEMDRKTINKWLDLFEKDKMIKRFTLPNNQGVIFTVVRYEQYQDNRTGPIDGPGPAHSKGHTIRTKEFSPTAENSRPREGPSVHPPKEDWEAYHKAELEKAKAHKEELDRILNKTKN